MNESAIIFYIDDDVHGQAIRIARKKDVELVTSNEAGNSGADDSVHFAYAIEHGYILVTANIKDFVPMFTEWLEGGNEHPGMVVITSQRIKIAWLIANTLEIIQHAGNIEDIKNQIWWL